MGLKGEVAGVVGLVGVGHSTGVTLVLSPEW